MKRINLIILVLASLGFLTTGCKKDDPSPSLSAVDYGINYFIWSTMSNYYLWTEDVPKLTPEYFNSDSNKLKSFLNQYSDHDKLFIDLLYDDDEWSFMVDDYTELENSLAGISKSMGYDFMLGLYGSGNSVLGYVRYVLKGSPADAAGIKRGYIFTHVNDQQLTTSNYADLLLNTDSYKLSFVDIVNNSLVLNNKTATMTAVEITENPIFLDTVYTINSQKIGYLMYNQFISTYDRELNNVMLDFKNKGVTNLILDLRYNLGGSGTSASYLASMIHGTNTSEVFYKTQYNAALQDYLTQQFGANYFVEKFQSYILNSDNSQTNIISLNLSDVYIITSNNTASASELVITGLKPYMNVHLIGDTTVGKYVGSMTFKDYIDDNYTVNPNHKWAIQPIMMKVVNSNGVTDYVGGFVPDVKIAERIATLGTLGDINEPLLAATISQITNVQKKSAVLPSQFKTERLESFKGHPGKVSGLIFPANKELLRIMKKK